MIKEEEGGGCIAQLCLLMAFYGIFLKKKGSKKAVLSHLNESIYKIYFEFKSAMDFYFYKYKFQFK